MISDNPVRISVEFENRLKPAKMSNYDCPNCQHREISTKLIRADYAGRNLFQCPECAGQLVKAARLDAINKRVDKDIAGLNEEVGLAVELDLEHEIRCPRCKNEMDKESVSKNPPFRIDRCDGCEMVWLDPGELAKLQLKLEASPQTQELNRMRERLETMTEEQRQEHETNLSKLSNEEFLVGLVNEGMRLGHYRNFW